MPDEIRRCTVFLAYETATEGRKFAGTGFLVVSESGDGSTRWLVTARHVLRGARSYSSEEHVYARVNRPAGADWIPIPFLGWTDHPDTAQDVSVFPVMGEFDDTESLFFPLSNLVDAKVVADWSIGPGDEVVIVGLFRQYAETARNIPIVRIGFIAAMPEEKVSTDTGELYVYLVEARSIGGLSGSPSFLYFGSTRVHPISGKFRPIIRPEYALLGLVHGHYRTVSSDQLDGPGANEAGDPSASASRPDAVASGLSAELINSGLAMVIPAPYIREAIAAASAVSLPVDAVASEGDREGDPSATADDGLTGGR